MDVEKPSPSSPTSVLGVESEEDLYTKLKHLQRELEFVQIQEEYVKDEQKNLKIELLRAQEEVKRIQAVPLVIGQFLEMVDENAGIVSSTTGSNYYVRILSTLNRELLKPSSSVALHRHSNALVDILPPEADSSISLLTDAERPDVKYSDVGGMDVQKQVRVAGLSQIQTPFDMLCRVQLRKSYHYNKCTRVQHCSARVRPTVYSYKSRSRLTFFFTLAGNPRSRRVAAYALRFVPPNRHRPAPRCASVRPPWNRQDHARQGRGAPHHRRVHPRGGQRVCAEIFRRGAAHGAGTYFISQIPPTLFAHTRTRRDYYL
jgi:hypothetical protein|tara:strand:- start:2368 stop:3315 length:948 start_codon:yes stop_codon:yes gene_type:complete